jgi:hypothetical protein
MGKFGSYQLNVNPTTKCASPRNEYQKSMREVKSQVTRLERKWIAN